MEVPYFSSDAVDTFDAATVSVLSLGGLGFGGGGLVRNTAPALALNGCRYILCHYNASFTPRCIS